MRIVIMGTGPFAVPSAQKIIELGHQIPLVVTRPVSSTVKKIPPRPVYDWARGHGLELYEPPSINSSEAIERLRAHQADLYFVCDYGQILSAETLTTSRLGGINLHGSLLPRHRGAAPVQWTLLAGDDQAGVTVIHMTPKLDAGPALAVRVLTILADENAGQLEARLAELGVDATQQAISTLQTWDGLQPIGQLQDHALITKAPRLAKQDGQLDFRQDAQSLVRRVRACQPWPSTFAELVWPTGKRMLVLIRAARAVESSSKEKHEVGQAQLVTANDLGLDWTGSWRTLIAVTTSAGSFLISRIQPAGKREMDVAEFVRGHPLSPGTGFALPV